MKVQIIHKLVGWTILVLLWRKSDNYVASSHLTSLLCIHHTAKPDTLSDVESWIPAPRARRYHLHTQSSNKLFFCVRTKEESCLRKFFPLCLYIGVVH